MGLAVLSTQQKETSTEEKLEAWSKYANSLEHEIKELQNRLKQTK
jgi:hypothetical protein